MSGLRLPRHVAAWWRVRELLDPVACRAATAFAEGIGWGAAAVLALALARLLGVLP